MTQVVQIMRIAPLVSMLIASLLTQGQTWTFHTGAPELSKVAKNTVPMDQSQYRKFVDQLPPDGPIVPVRKSPTNLSVTARYGYNFKVDGKNRGWILDGDDRDGWVLYLDWKGDGDLSNTPPKKFERVDGLDRLQIEVSDGAVRWPCLFEVARLSVQGRKVLGVRITDSTFRSGEIVINGRRFPFRLDGMNGRYDSLGSTVSVDRFGSGDWDTYKVSDRALNLDGRTYEFTVDSLGASLTLTEMTESQPDRPSLSVGALAPGFVAKDLAGMTRSLNTYKGKMLLIEFWATSCGPCRGEAPLMAEFYAKTVREKIDFLGVSSDTSDENLRLFLKKFKMSWPQIREPFDGPVHQVYRVAGEPTYYLIGTNGEVLDAWVGAGESRERISRFLNSR